jgi:hypothetical protein
MIKTILCMIVLFMTLPTNQVKRRESPRKLVFVGTVQLLASDPGILSGDLAIYRLASYNVEQVCEGEYTGKKIVVDHLILTGKELQGVKVGDRVCVSAEKSKSVLARFNAEGIRSPHDRVKVFFVGGRITSKSEALRCPCCPTTEQ